MTPCGVLLVDKPAGVTSHDVVAQIRRVYGTRQVGHTGTLDPMATGLLVVLVGRAVKAAEYLSSGTKTYEAVMRLGVTTDTGDTTGRVTRTCAEIPGFEDICAAAAGFTGRQTQIPPMYSAVKVGGVKLCDAARKGVVIPREPREIEIFSIKAGRTAAADEVTLSVRCSGGTYIRTLCEDIGNALGCGAAMAALRRTGACGFDISGAVPPAALAELDEAGRTARLIPVERLFDGLPEVRLNAFFSRLGKNGCPLYLKKLGMGEIGSAGGRVRMYDETGAFFALGQIVDTPDGAAVRAVKRFDITE